MFSKHFSIYSSSWRINDDCRKVVRDLLLFYFNEYLVMYLSGYSKCLRVDPSRNSIASQILNTEGNTVRHNIALMIPCATKGYKSYN